jgi:hypothetical protein
MRNFKEIYRELEQYTDIQKKAIGLCEICMVSGTVANVNGYTDEVTVSLKEEETQELVFCSFDKSYEPMLVRVHKGQRMAISGMVYWNTWYCAKMCSVVREVAGQGTELTKLFGF